MTEPPQRERVHVTLFGGLVVAVGDREISGAAWPTRRSAELVALLSLSDRHRLVRDRVVDALWPHLDPDAGAANLRKAAHHARQASTPRASPSCGRPGSVPGGLRGVWWVAWAVVLLALAAALAVYLTGLGGVLAAVAAVPVVGVVAGVLFSADFRAVGWGQGSGEFVVEGAVAPPGDGGWG